ncbi:insulin-like receptor [Anastrepha obliqua]|uniref:insulin-like receptor n=1 Tax=Anastrepha obliqua TaxID=95512 RepID=UPI00240A06A4|nr:insulin-like receptor [Anastrepha obliqua]XP_054726734.1 insulin-like receptor [Anastrepha obliqua]XP_054726735.1 insulin-like receptor [Anastrepha obliqua]XP_054726736.1 insulin-like receptor [Anastrepha obliqua]
MDVKCERLVSHSDNSHSHVAVHELRHDNMARIERQSVVANYTLRSRRRSAAAAAAQRIQNATDTGGGAPPQSVQHGANRYGTKAARATFTSQQKPAASEMSASVDGAVVVRQNVCVLCRQGADKCCSRNFGSFTMPSATAGSNSSGVRNGQASSGNSVRRVAAVPDTWHSSVVQRIRQPIDSTIVETPPTISATTNAAKRQSGNAESSGGQWVFAHDDSCSFHTATARLTNSGISALAIAQQQHTQPNDGTASTPVYCSCQQRTPQGMNCVPQTLPAPTAVTTSHLTKAAIITTTSPAHSSSSADLELRSVAECATSPKATATAKPAPASSSSASASLALAAGTNFIEQRKYMLNEAPTTVATSIHSPAPFATTLRTFQLLLLCIQMQLLRPIYKQLNSFLHKANSNRSSSSSNNNKNNKQHTTNSNRIHRNSKNSNTQTKSNKRQQKQNPQLQQQQQQQQQRPPLLRLMKLIRCNSYYNNNNKVNDNNLINNCNNNATNIFNASHKQQLQYANANANNHSSNNSTFSNSKCSQLQHHMHHRTVQQQQQQQQILQQEHHCNLMTTSHQQNLQHQHQQQQQQKYIVQHHLKANVFASTSLQLQLQHLRYFKMPNLSFLHMLLIALSFLSLFLPSINAQASNAIATAAASAPVSNDVRPSQVALGRNETVCRSLDIRNSPSELSQLSNCTVIEGFLLITLINQHNTEEFPPAFPLLTEVTEFIIIYRVHYLRSLSQIFPNLSIIRGTTLFEGYALIVYYNPHLEDLGLSKLTTISRGGVRLENNIVLCYVKTIAWKRILNGDAEISIDNNSKEIECPKCPGDTRTSRLEDGADSGLACKEFDGQRRCWSSKECQKICPDHCKHNCVNEDTCCNENCLGGCSPTNLYECNSCRDFAIYNNTCIDQCPEGYFSYLDRRCLTADECITIGTKFENNKPQSIVPYDGKCSTRCPNGYNKIGTTCQACGDNCVNKCDGALIDSVERAKDFTGCTHIVKNGLTISIKRGGKHLMEELESGLSSIQEISTFLKIQGTYGLTSLSFFKHLKRINGTELDENKFAIYALENNDLETVWGPNRTVSIERGRVFFHFNPKLCYDEIEKLLPMMKENATFDKNEVARDSNGHKGSCNTELLNVTIAKVSSRVAVVRIENPLIFDDNRTFIGYQYFYIEDKYKNATKYSQRICDDGWIVSDPTKETQYIFINLQPFTQYAYYVKTWTISSEKRNAQSPIMHFKTKSAQPKLVHSLNAYAISSSEIAIAWTPPDNPQGNLTFYRLHATLDKRSQVLDSRDYCKDPAQIDKDDDTKDSTRLSPGVTEAPNAANCKCDGDKSQSHSDTDTSEESIVASIDFENTLQNFIYVKHTNDSKRWRSSSDYESDASLTDMDAKRRRRRHSEGDPEDSFLVRHMRGVPDSRGNVISKTTADDANAGDATIITTAAPIETTTLGNTNTSANNDTRMDPTGQYYESIMLNVSVTTNKYVFKDLKYFSFYTIGVEACREYEKGATEKECSDVRLRFVRTKKLEGVDKVQNLRVDLVPTNTTRSDVRVRWSPPENPNGDVVSYTISYKKSEQDAAEEKRCITEVFYRNLTNGYVMPLPTGNYSIRVRANSLAGDGVYSDVVYIDIPPEKWSGALIAGICIAIIGVLLLMGGVYWYVRRKYAPPNDIKIIPTVNPYYIGLQYKKDSWEVARDRVIQLCPLGQGSFGMVYEGILKGSNDSTEDTPCAIKTVNENATDRERINFLSEASVMKQFDTHHVVRLLGVCSVGQPALVVMELMKFGDLKSYLRAHRPDSIQGDELPFRYREAGVQAPPLSRVFQMAIEIADGMAYLSAKKFVHRDLAARNCMVGADLTVKIGDFGMTRDVYETDYYRKGDKGLLPVRWMPPESLRDGIYSTASDVFSYGVVLWEIVTLASQPYPGYSNDQVLRFVIEGGVMERPDNCPDKIYEIMQQCWEHRPSKRPSFFKIINTLFEHVDTDSEGYLAHFRLVSYFFSDQGLQEREKERAESMRTSGDIFSEENEIDDATTPLRTDEFNEYKLNLANTSSIDHEGESPMAIDDDHPHSPYSHSLGSANIVSSTPDGQSKNSYNFSQMSHNNPTLLSSVPSTSAGIVSGGSHSHSHPLHQPTSHQRQTHYSQFPTEEAAANYVLPDYDPQTVIDGKNAPHSTMAGGSAETDERGYEMYDPSPNYREHVPYDPALEEEDFDGLPLGGHSARIGSGGQQLLPRHKPRHRMPIIMPMSSSMPDEMTGTPISSSLHPSTASAASSNASSTNAATGRYSSLKAVADKVQSMPLRFKNINRRIFNHKRTGSNSSQKSTTSNPNATTSSSSNSNLAGATVGRGKSMSGQNLGTIESGGSGSASSYVTPRFFTPASDQSSMLTRDNPNYRLLDETANTSCLTGAGDATPHSTGAFSTTGNTNYKRLDESLNTTSTPGKPTVTPTAGSSTAPSGNSCIFPPLNTTTNPNYVVMNEPMGLAMPPTRLPYSSSTAPMQSAQLSESTGYTMMGPMALDPSNKDSSASSVNDDPKDDDDDDDNNADEDDEPTEHIKMELLGGCRRGSDRAQQHRKSRGNRSRSQSQKKLDEKAASKTCSSPATTPSGGLATADEGCSSYMGLTPMTTATTTTVTPAASTQPRLSATYSLKEKWLRQQAQQPPQPPPNGFIGREA